MPKGSKWAGLREKYPKMPMDAEYGERVEVVLNSPVPGGTDVPLRAMPFNEHIQLYNYLRNGLDKLDDLKSEMNLQLEAVEHLIAGYYEAHDILTQKFDDGTSITVAPDPVVSVANETEFYGWLKAEPDRAVDYKMREYVFPATVKSQVKWLLENGGEPPPGVAVFYQNQFTSKGR